MKVRIEDYHSHETESTTEQCFKSVWVVTIGLYQSQQHESESFYKKFDNRIFITTTCQKATVDALPTLVSYWNGAFVCLSMLWCPFAMSPPTSWWTYARWWCPNADSLVFRSGRKFSHKNHWIGFQQYFTFTAVDFYNHKLEAVERKVGGK